MTEDNIRLADNPARQRFELHKDGALAAFAEYNLLEGTLRFTHTEVLPAHEGQGLGSTLATFALDQVAERGQHAIPACSFIAAHIRRHPQYLPLVAPEHRSAARL